VLRGSLRSGFGEGWLVLCWLVMGAMLRAKALHFSVGDASLHLIHYLYCHTHSNWISLYKPQWLIALPFYIGQMIASKLFDNGHLVYLSGVQFKLNFILFSYYSLRYNIKQK
jgi:hypothetical protein